MLLAVPLVGWLYWEYGVKTSEQRYFESQIPKLEAAGEEGVPLKEMTNFDWDVGCLIGPYGGFSREMHDGGKYKDYELDVGDVYSDSDRLWFVVFANNYKKRLTAINTHLRVNDSRKAHICEIGKNYKAMIRQINGSKTVFFIKGNEGTYD